MGLVGDKGLITAYYNVNVWMFSLDRLTLITSAMTEQKVIVDVNI